LPLQLQLQLQLLLLLPPLAMNRTSHKSRHPERSEGPCISPLQL
jgi:hypothetical protein